MPMKKEDVEPTVPLVPPQAQTEEQKKARSDAIKRHTDIRRAVAWPLHRTPLEKQFASQYIAKGKAKLVLPRSYRMGDGEDRTVIRPHDDLNAVVFRWYDERVNNADKERRKGVNFVAKDGVISRRHEYLGPDPRVAGYQLGTDGNIRIRWWDGFLQDPWVGNEKWNVEVTYNAQGEWVENAE